MSVDQTLKDDFQINIKILNSLSIFRSLIKWRPFKVKRNIHSKLFESKTNVDRLINDIEKPNGLCIEISSEKINMLLEQRLICAADIRCLDASSKQCLKKLCLKTCLYSTPSYTSASRLPDDLHLASSTLQLEKL